MDVAWRKCLFLLSVHEADDGSCTLIGEPPLLQEVALCLIDTVQLLLQTAANEGL